MTPESRRKIAAAKAGDKNPMYGTIAPNRKLDITAEELRDLYITKKHSSRWIAKHLNVHWRTVANWLTRYGIRLAPGQLSERRLGENNPSYHGGRITQRGYIYRKCTAHPQGTRDGYVMEHRLVMERLIGRTVADGEQIHHRNFDKMDNSDDNLILFHSGSDHTRYHKYLESVGAYVLGHTKIAPVEPKFEAQIFSFGAWGPSVKEPEGDI